MMFFLCFISAAGPWLAGLGCVVFDVFVVARLIFNQLCGCLWCYAMSGAWVFM